MWLSLSPAPQLRAEPGPESPPVSPQTLTCGHWAPRSQRRKVSSERRETCREGGGAQLCAHVHPGRLPEPLVRCKGYSRTAKCAEHSSEVMVTQGHKPSFSPSAGESRHSVPGAQTVQIPTDPFHLALPKTPRKAPDHGRNGRDPRFWKEAHSQLSPDAVPSMSGFELNSRGCTCTYYMLDMGEALSPACGSFPEAGIGLLVPVESLAPSTCVASKYSKLSSVWAPATPHTPP